MAAIEVDHLGKQYQIGRLQERRDTLRDTLADLAGTPLRWLRVRGREARPPEMIWALKDVSFDVQRGEVVGIIGRNGAGKSTLLKVLSRITEPTEGRAKIRGRVGSLLEVGTGFHQELTGRENVYLNGAILGMRRAEIDRKFDEIVAFAGVEKFIDTPVKRYSSGMYLRLAFAVAAHLDLEILLVDEVLAVGDAEFQKKCLGKMGDIAGEGRTVLLVSHNMAAIKRLCERVVLLDRGRVLSIGEASDVVAQYLLQGQTGSGVVEVGQGDPNVAMIHRVGAINAQGEFSSYLPADEDFRLYIECSVAQTLYKAQIGFAVLAADGTIVFVSAHSDGLPLDQTTLLPGHYRLAVRVPGQFLNVGGYSLNARIWGALEGHERAAHASAFSVFAFQVEETGSMAARLRDRRGGLVTPLLEWEAVPDLAAQP